MINSILKKLNGNAIDADSLSAALLQLGRERDETRSEIVALKQRKHQLLLDDGSDADLDKIERLIDRAETRLEKIAIAEPVMRERISAAKIVARQRRWRELHDAYLVAAADFLASARTCAARHEALNSIVAQAQSGGFESEVAARMAKTPNVGGAALLAGDLLDTFERALVAATSKPSRSTPDLYAAHRGNVGKNHRNPIGISVPVAPSPKPSLQRTVAGHTTLTVSPLDPAGKNHADRLDDDLSVLGPGEVRAMVIRSGYCALDGGQSHSGRKVRVLKEHALIAAKNGAIEILDETPLPPNASGIESVAGNASAHTIPNEGVAK
jgi:hypothetical protein